MTAVLALGLRLAGGTRGQRLRSALVAATAGLGTLVMLVVLALLNMSRLHASYYGEAELGRLISVVVAAIALPIATMAATVGRLSAALRDRRLANLRLLGLSAVQTRVVAAVEAGAAGVVGSTVGAGLFALLSALHPIGQSPETGYGEQHLWPLWSAYLVAGAGIPLLVTLVSSLPQRLDSRRALERARRADTGRPSWWRVLPLVIGMGLCVASWSANADYDLTNREVAILFAGIALTGLGLVVIAPVFVRIWADALLTMSRNPSIVIAARRLQAQPAAVTRVIAVLMLGLFLVVGARSVVAAFESTSQYRGAESQLRDRQWAVAAVAPDATDRLVSRARSVPGVRDVVAVPWLVAQRGGDYRPGRGADFEVAVATCAELARLAPDAKGCVDGEPLWLYPFGASRMPRRITLAAADDNEARNGRGPTLTLSPGARVAGRAPGPGASDLFGPVSATLVLPPTMPGLSRVATQAQRQIVVLAKPGRGLEADLITAGVPVSWAPDLLEYDFVAGLRALLYTIAAVILSLGLLTFGVAAIDRALARRRELVALQMFGTPTSVLRRAQWLEALLPIMIGTLLAIVAGWFAGATYLRLDGEWSEHLGRVVPATLGIAAAATLGSLLVAGLTVIATGTRLTSDVIRTE